MRCIHNALVYVNAMGDGQVHTRYQETVTTYSEGVVKVGTSAINAAEEGQAYAFLMENGLERHQLYTYLEDQNVPDDCTDDSPARLFGLEAAVAMAGGAEVDFEDRIINKLTGKARCVYDKLVNSSTDFKAAIKKFDGEFPVAHLKYSMDNNPCRVISKG